MIPKILLTIPVYNEELILENSINKILSFLRGKFHNYSILIANNGSTDKTEEIARKIVKKHKVVKLLNIKEKGRGIALKMSWLRYPADIYSYMDVDLATDLAAYPKMIQQIAKGYDIVTGSRYLKGSIVDRSLYRTILSNGYNFLIRRMFKTSLTDMQCGFKACTKKIVTNIVGNVCDNAWFFDTELLILSERKGFKIKEIPIHWKADNNSKVRIVSTIKDYIINSINLSQTLTHEGCTSKSKLAKSN
jgi:glycosyltransferase involved in cell wall biosynthesis